MHLVNAACCYKRHAFHGFCACASVSLCVAYYSNSEPCKNGRTDQVAAWDRLSWAQGTIIRWGVDWRHLANINEQSMHGSEAVLRHHFDHVFYYHCWRPVRCSEGKKCTYSIELFWKISTENFWAKTWKLHWATFNNYLRQKGFPAVDMTGWVELLWKAEEGMGRAYTTLIKPVVESKLQTNCDVIHFTSHAPPCVNQDILHTRKWQQECFISCSHSNAQLNLIQSNYKAFS